jgi:hypothetical protein
MPKKITKYVFFFILQIFFFFIACSNPIMEKWWIETGPEPEYIPITKNIPQIIYETVYERVKEYEKIHDQVFIELPPEIIINTIYDTQIITEMVEVIIPVTADDVVQYLKDNCDDPEVKEVIKEVIKQQPPQVILQTINIIDIEYIIFSGDASVYNGKSPTGGTNLTDQEKTTNDVSISSMAGALKIHNDYFIMLHGHANPVNFTDGETVELKALSLSRAQAVLAELSDKFEKLSGTIAGLNEQLVSVTGYGGEKNLYGSNSTYAGLNRRVEMILFRVGF